MESAAKTEPVAIPGATEGTASAQTMPDGDGMTYEQQTDPYPPDGSSYFSTGLSVDSDADSTLGDVDVLTSTQSVRSSIYEFVEENGRTFHKYKQGNLQHNIFILLLKGDLARAPVKDPQRVLDIGTGTGIWAMEYADVLGIDLSPIQPNFVPPNCHFEIEDAEDEWAYGTNLFDLIHLRLVWHSFNDPIKVLQSAYDNLKPGGYIEWQDFLSRFRSVDDSLAGSALKRLDQLYYDGGQKLGRDMDVTPKIASMMRKVGFVDVVEERYALPGNPWPKGKEAKTLGYWQMNNFSEGLQAITMTVLTKGVGMSVPEVELLLMEVRKDIKNTNIHFYLPV
ncbi:methyltransferase domain-containing protein [Ophiostoma piceae UAMH 11346]|uniref:Methyltransferase domain-containing protein n=1 Tax=Ophiostoma piceae (strain UAMH 11346) TaxID=1262450 RepID=S3CUE7_OPHP1|nr:methyltransferase domain-containing protein [Ophiostoma piceae UAMH 11346]